MSFAETIQAFSQVVVFIDDGFRPVSLGLIDADDWASLRSAATSDPACWIELQAKYFPSLKSLLDLKREEKELANAWELYEKEPQELAILDPIFKRISATRDNAIRPLREIMQFLRDDLKLTVCCHPDIESAEQDIKRSKLVFLDFYLYQQSTTQKAIEDIGRHESLLSSKVEIGGVRYDRFLFLISTHLPASDDIERFRNAAKIKAAFFKPVSKDSLNRKWVEDELTRRLRRYDDLHRLASYLDIFSEQMERVMEDLRIDLEALELHDLAILDHMRLKADGEDLGSYMSWLMSEALAARIRASAPMLEASKNVSVVQRPPFHGMLTPNQVLFSWFAEITFASPSPEGSKVQFGDVFSAATTANLQTNLSKAQADSDQVAHVQVENEDLAADKGCGICAWIGRSAKLACTAIGGAIERRLPDIPAKIPAILPPNEAVVSSGDQTSSGLILVIAPACDLQRLECDYEVLCVRGAVIKQTPNLVDLLEHRNFLGKDKESGKYKHLLRRPKNGTPNYLLVEWYPEKLTTILATELQVGQFSRLARLNELFCQEIKEDSLRQVGRVGVPVDPAFSIGLGATIVYTVRKKGTVHIEIPDSDTVSGVYTSGNANNSARIILSEEFLERFDKEVEKIVLSPDPALADVLGKLNEARSELLTKGGEGFELSNEQRKIANQKFTIQYKSEFIRQSGEKGFCGVYFYPRGSIQDPNSESAKAPELETGIHSAYEKSV
jgi:hypothetical protein